MKERVEIKVNYDDVRVTVDVDKKRYINCVAESVSIYLKEDVKLYDEDIKEELVERYECGELSRKLTNLIEIYLNEEFYKEAKEEWERDDSGELENSCWGEI